MKEAKSRGFGNRPCRKVLLTEDDAPLAKFIAQRLTGDDLAVTIAEDGEAALKAFNGNRFDLLILDLGLPKLDGIGLLKSLRPNYPKLPVLVLTARAKIEERVSSLDAGADDHLVKPFSTLELKARVRALLRRNSGVVPPISQIADLTLDRERWTVDRSGTRVDLTAKEFRVLEILVRNARQPVSRASILEEVWNIPVDPTSNLVDVYVKYVRDKVDSGRSMKLIRTIRNVGYMVSDE